MRNIMRRSISIILCLAMVTTVIPHIPGINAATASEGMEAVKTSQTVEQDGIYYTIDRTTQYMGNRTYSVQVNVSSDLSSYEHARIRTAARNGYVTIQQTGYYLIELWGGDGADGWLGVTGAIIIPLPTPKGNGAAGGYVYGKVFLKEGQTLVYNIGTNGAQSAVHNDGAGGVNGDGGTHGQEGSYAVGGGGGYTAIYLFEEGEFREEYVTETALHIPEVARLSRYLMIAGGGGGGGAGIGGTLLTLADNGSPPSAPNGGAGGSVNWGGMSLLGEDYDVPGYVFPGRNGLSSGTDTTWIGRGGSNVPGVGSITVGEQFRETTRPNDWTGSYTPSVEPGAGGSGNFRGGGGGSGYAGGSGGLMKGQVLASHVGGGGGGSSFIAAEVNGEKIQFSNLDENTTKYISGSGNQPIGAATGGACQITYLGEQEEQLYEDTLKDVTLNTTISKYFDVVASSSSTGADLKNTVNADGSTSIKAEGLSITPSSPAHSGDVARVTLYLRAKSDFMGGNAVEMLQNMQLDFISPNDNVTPVTIPAEAKRSLDFVNVPLIAKLRTKSYTSSQKGKSYQVTGLYEDDYANVRDTLASYWQYDYVSYIGDYLTFVNGTQITSATVAPTETTHYDIQYTVTVTDEPDDEVIVGPANKKDTVISGVAVISVVEPDTALLNSLLVSGSKNLTYGDGKYDFSVNLSQTSDTVVMENTTMSTSTAGDGAWEAPCDGWYYLQTWGGNGGNSGTASSTGVNGQDTRSVGAGTGGTGGYVTGYIYLRKGDILTYNVGAAGSTGASDTGNRLSATGWRNFETFRGNAGGGGTYTAISLDGTTLMVAGGGGGAGQSILTLAQYAILYPATATRNGNSVSSSISTTLNSVLSNYSGSAGSNNASGNCTGILGIPQPTATAGTAGTAGSNYRMSDLASGYDTTASGITLPVAAEKYASQQSTTKSVRGGKIAITLVSNNDSQDVYDKLLGVETKVAISRYFDIDEVTFKTGDSYSKSNVVDNGDGSKTITYLNASSEVVAKFTYRIDTAADGVSQVVTITDVEYIPDPYTKTEGGIYYLYYMSTLEMTYSLTPKEGFLGGNDVPVLAYGQVGDGVDSEGYADNGVRIIQGDGTMNLQAKDPTDYANVSYDASVDEMLAVQDKTIHLGESVNKTDLYTFTAPTYGSDAWEDDYAYFASPGDETYTPKKTTDYLISMSYTPRVETAQKATIVDSIAKQDYALEATVFVELPVEYNLSNLQSDGVKWVLYGTNYGCTLTPNTGYLLPEEIEVTIDGAASTNYTYNSSLGTVSIDKDYVTGPIVIAAKADVKTYDIHLVYTEYNPETGMDEKKELVKTGYEADTTIDWEWLDKIAEQMPEREGYEYRLSYDTPDRMRPETMPANNLWVYGSYEKAEYLLTITYVYEDGTEAAETHQSAVVYGDSYSVVSPLYPTIEKKGYMPDVLTVTGEMGAGNVDVTVTYKPTQNMLYISYQKEDGTELGHLEKTLQTDEAFSEISPHYDGYTPDISLIEGVMSGDESEIFVVIYTANTYTLHFDVGDGEFADATMDSDTKLVEYDNFYSYNAAEDIYDGLPIPQLTGYTFVGWYFDKALTQELLATDKVDLLDDETVVYAKWKRASYKLTVKYDFLYTDGDFLPEGFDSADAVRATLTDHEETVEYGTEYEVTLPAFVGYSSYRNFGLNDQEKLSVLTGTMPAQNRVVIISFEINTYEIRFADKPGENVTYSDAETATTATDTFDTVWDTVYVKHNIVPIYSVELDEPNHATREEYTYNFTGWKSSVDDAIYAGKSPTFPEATSDCEYRAMYDATENIVSVKAGSTTKHFTKVAEAVVYAESNMSSSPTITFRRNNGNGKVVDVTGDTIVLGNTYAGTTAYTLYINLNGCNLVSTQGEPVIENKHRYLPLVINDTVGGGGISTSGNNDVIAIDVNARNLTINHAITVSAMSENGDATAIAISANTANVYLYLQATINLSAIAQNGVATAIDVADSSYTVYISPSAKTTLAAEGNNAIGLDVGDATTSISNVRIVMDVNATETAIGIRISENATLLNSSVLTEKLIVNSQDKAYGIWNEGTISSLNMKLDVDAVGDAYGLYNNGGTLTVTGVGTSVDISADSQNGNGYGLYNNGGSIGDESDTTGTYLKTGAFAGSSYGIFSENDDIYVAGNELYFKGADKESAMDGTVVYPEFQQTEANAPYEGYYRLAMSHTITFVTNGGTEIATITQLYDTPLTVEDTTRLGYKFINWHQNEELTSVYIIPTNMPDEDLTLYAEWELIQYKYALDTSFSKYTVRFYQNKSSSDTSLFGEVVVDKDNKVLNVPVEDPTYISGSTLYIFNGWYTQRNDTAATHVTLDGDLADIDKDGDGIIELYAGWESMSSAQSYVSFNTNPSSAYVTGSHSSSRNYRMYFVVPADGDYSVSVGNVANGTTSSYQKDLRIYTYKHGTKSSEFVNSYTNATTSLTYVNYNSSNYSGLRNLKAGDVLVVQLYYRSSSSTYNSTVYAKISATPAGYKEEYSAYATEGVEILNYTVEMGNNGIVDLPVADSTGHEGYRFVGWADTENAVAEDYIMQLNPNMINTVPEWQNGELWQLYSQWEEATWKTYTSAGRNFSDFTSMEDVSIEDDETLSIRFNTDETVKTPVVFKFENGLPKGTILTLVDKSDEIAKYYTYTVHNELATELSSTKFEEMGKTSNKYDGKGTDIILQICYTHADIVACEEVVSLYMGGMTSEVDARYTVSNKTIIEIDHGSTVAKYNETFTALGGVPSLLGKGYSDTDKVFLRIRWDGGSLAPGAMFTVGKNTAIVYDGEFAKMNLGTVADFTSDQIASGVVNLATMMQNEFENKNFIYEICVVDEMTGDGVVFGNDVDVVARATQTVTLTETPVLTVSDLTTRGVTQRDVLSIGTISVEDASASDVELYLFTLSEDKQFVYTDACATVFDSSAVTIAEDGKLSLNGTLITDGVFETTISETAEVGKYYLRIVYGDKYAIVPIQIS